MDAPAHLEVEHIAPYLAIRRRGSSEWVVIDPNTSRGRRLAASFGFTITPKENAMSAVPIGYSEEHPTTTHLKVVQNNVEQMGLLLSAREKGRAALAYIRKAPRVAWDWVRRTFHLDPAVDFVRSVLTWLRNQISILAAHFGSAGGVGLGLLAVSTSIGRQMLAFALKPVFFALNLLGSAWTWAENALYVDETPEKPLGLISRIRNWLSERMASLREVFTGNGTTPGLIERVGAWYFNTVAPHLHLDSTAMVAARTAGLSMVTVKAVTALAFIPMSAAVLGPLQFILGGLLGLGVVSNGWELGRRGWARVKAIFAPAVVEAAEEASATAEKVTAIPTPAAAGAANRATRRASGKQARRRPAPAPA